MASADPLLTTQCSVCRAGPPRYRCPRCSLQYCSVLCNRRHKARTNCSGIRDVTAFVPRSTLRTAQGIDRDYNFLQGIDVARSVAVKHVVDERRVLRAHEAKAVVLNEEDPEEKERNNDKNSRGRWQHKHNKYGQSRRVRGNPNQHNKQSQTDKKEQGQPLYKTWEGDEVVYRPSRKMAADAAAALLESVRAEAAAQDSDDSDDSDDDSDTPKPKTKSSSSKPPTFEAGVGPRVKSKCRRKNIDLLGAPPGFMRQKQNQTTIVTETLRGKGGAAATTVVFLHWQVEWLIYADTDEGSTPTQVLRRAKDWTPLYRAYAALQQAERQRQEREAKLGNALVKEVAEGEDKKTVETARKDDKDTAMDTRGDSDDEAEGEGEAESQSPKQSRRNRKPRHKTTAPFNNSFFFAYDVQHAQDVMLAQDPATAEAAATAVPSTAGTATATTAWHAHAVTDDMPEQDLSVHMYHNARYEYSYYLLKPHVPGVVRASQAKELIPVDSADTLSTVLPGRSVLEFPTIYVLPRGAPLPKGHVLGSVGRRVFFDEPAKVKGKQPQRKGQAKANGANKRQNKGKQGPTAKKLKMSGKNNKGDSEEEGEIVEGDGDVELPDAKPELESETSSSGTDSSDEEEEEEEEESSEDDDDDDGEESNDDEKGSVTLSHLLNTIGNAGTMPADGKPKLVVYDSWSEGSDDA